MVTSFGFRLSRAFGLVFPRSADKIIAGDGIEVEKMWMKKMKKRMIEREGRTISEGREIFDSGSHFSKFSEFWHRIYGGGMKGKRKQDEDWLRFKKLED